MNKLYIMCAFPGAGKGWWISQNIPGALVCSADTAMIEDDGVYRFKPKLLGKAHADCAANAKAAMKRGVGEVVIDNTNLATWQMSKYLEVANKYGYEVEIIRITTDPAVAFARQMHDVPSEGHARMVKQFNQCDLPEGVAVREVTN